MERSTFYQTIWRWHFYAGLFVMPMVLILATTGAIYLFKPQVERWEERAWQGLPTEGLVAPSIQRDAALAAFPGSSFHSLRLPEYPGDAVMVHLNLPRGEGMRDVFVSPQGKVLGALDPQRRIAQVVHDIHGELLLGKRGSWIVELAASWAIVMIVTGLYLWWPAQGGLAGVVWPRLRSRGRLFWRDLHAVTGFWVSAFALILLLTGLPWAGVWGSSLDFVREQAGWIKGKRDWTIGGAASAGEHAGHDHAAMAAGMPAGHVHAPASSVPLEMIVAQAESEHLAFPVIVAPPAGPDTGWTVRSDAQNRPLRVTIKYDGRTGYEVSRETFADKHPIDQVVGYGIAWHEGQLFGLANQLIGVATALALITLSVSGFVMWRKRKPAGLGAPPKPNARLQGKGVPVIMAAFFVLLPLFALSIVALWLFDRLALPHMPRLAGWLGVRPRWA
jgi:uncharacterized iron-regulated membrane protein